MADCTVVPRARSACNRRRTPHTIPPCECRTRGEDTECEIGADEHARERRQQERHQHDRGERWQREEHDLRDDAQPHGVPAGARRFNQQHAIGCPPRTQRWHLQHGPNRQRREQQPEQHSDDAMGSCGRWTGEVPSAWHERRVGEGAGQERAGDLEREELQRRGPLRAAAAGDQSHQPAGSGRCESRESRREYERADHRETLQRGEEEDPGDGELL